MTGAAGCVNRCQIQGRPNGRRKGQRGHVSETPRAPLHIQDAAVVGEAPPTGARSRRSPVIPGIDGVLRCKCGTAQGQNTAARLGSQPMPDQRTGERDGSSIGARVRRLNVILPSFLSLVSVS